MMTMKSKSHMMSYEIEAVTYNAGRMQRHVWTSNTHTVYVTMLYLITTSLTYEIVMVHDYFFLS
jgi:hypothetical protein